MKLGLIAIMAVIMMTAGCKTTGATGSCGKGKCKATVTKCVKCGDGECKCKAAVKGSQCCGTCKKAKTEAPVAKCEKCKAEPCKCQK